MMLVIWLTLMLGLSDSIGAIKDQKISEALFYPFGEDVGDTMQPPGHCALSTAVPILANFPFFNASHRTLFVNSNGVISFLQPVPGYTPQPFPMLGRIITPFWSNIHTEYNDGRIYYRQSTDEILLNRATQDVRKTFSSKGFYFFKAKWIFIGTWHNVTHFDGNRTTPVNSFQVVLITDEKHSVAMFNYGWLSWPTEAMWGGISGSAQVGFNAGDEVHFLALPGSRQPNIIQVGQTSNVGLKGRWMFRVDSATIEASNSCETEPEKCAVHQQFDVKANSCLDVAPAFDCPTLDGPVVINRRWVEFYCTIPTKTTNDQSAAFNVTFLFNGEPAATVPSIVVQFPDRKATLHEKHLNHKLIGKWISCQVSSYWRNTKTIRYSRTVTSSNSYWAGIEVSTDIISVHEGDPNPATLTLKSTIPITCDKDTTDPCHLTLQLSSSPDIFIKGKNNQVVCSFTLREEDWKPAERKAYREGERIEVYAKIDYTVSSPRYNSLTIDINKLQEKETANGEKYMNMWSKHRLPDIMVYHHDAPQGVCRATGDPNLTTFDRLFYAVYASGEFAYVQTTTGNPIEVQVRHKPCGQAVSCACGVAIREKDLILIADKCTDNILRTVTPNEIQILPDGVGIKQDENGRSFQMTLPSRVRVVGYVTSWGMNIEISVTSAEYRRTEGLCGSFDQNMVNDLNVKGSNQIHSSLNFESLSEVVESWRIPSGASLFDGKPSKLNEGQAEQATNDDDGQSFCTCPKPESGCANTVFDNTLQVGGNKRFRRNTLRRTRKRLPNDQLPPVNRRRRDLSGRSADVEMTDDIDWEYNGSAFNYSSPEPARPVNVSRVTEEDARRHCQRLLWDESPMRTTCENLVSMNDVNGVIDKCVSDIRMTGDLSWADDKIPEIQNLCIFEAMTANITESNSTIEEIVSVVQQITAVVCLPQDCSGHGNCSKGTCICNKGYVGSDCALSEDAVPNINRTLGPASCDLDRYLCQKVAMVTKNVKSLPKLVCKVEVTKSDNSTESFETAASVETMDTSSCKLPTEVLQGSLRLIRTTSTPTTSPAEVEPVDFYSLPHGNPVLHYSISISNNGRLFSNIRPLIVYDSMCFSCDGLHCTRKEATCVINGYCFTNGQRNPFNPDCDRCNISVSKALWTKASDSLCNPCLSSPCSEGITCLSSLKGKYRCIEKPTQTDLTVTLVAIVTVVAVILTVIVVFFMIRRK
jgi:hypothetical protein